MARVKVDGDTRDERHLMLTSIRKRKEHDTKQANTNTATVTIDRKELQSLKDELTKLKKAVKALEDKIESLIN